MYYPDKNNIGDESKWVIMPGLKSLDDCQQWILKISKNNSNYDYEFGKKCKYNEDTGLLVCKETAK